MHNLFINSNYMQMALDGIWERDKIISHNISNIDTPNYKKKGVSFEKQLNEILMQKGFQGKKTRDKHLDIGLPIREEFSPEVYTVNDTSMREDENNVDIDAEMASQAKNAIQYFYLIEKTNQNLRKIRNVVNEGRR